MPIYKLILPNGNKIITPEQMSRTMFCPKCAESQCPKIDDSVLLYQTNRMRQSFSAVIENSEIEHWGYTPHWITDIIIDIEKQEAIYTKVCGVNGCGHSLEAREPEENTGKIIWDTVIQNSIRDTMPLNDFVAFINFKDPMYYVGIQKQP
jgi:hypothetical protein